MHDEIDDIQRTKAIIGIRDHYTIGFAGDLIEAFNEAKDRYLDHLRESLAAAESITYDTFRVHRSTKNSW